MSRTKRILILPLVFVLACVASFFIESPFQQMTRYFYRAFAHNKLYFFGKNFHLFPSDYFILSFGIFCVVFTMLLFRHTFMQGLYRTLLVLALFFGSVAVVSWINGTRYIATCTSCREGNHWLMSRRSINYDGVFIAGLSIALMPLVVTEMMAWFRKGPRKEHFKQGQFT